MVPCSISLFLSLFVLACLGFFSCEAFPAIQQQNLPANSLHTNDDLIKAKKEIIFNQLINHMIDVLSKHKQNEELTADDMNAVDDITEDNEGDAAKRTSEKRAFPMGNFMNRQVMSRLRNLFRESMESAPGSTHNSFEIPDEILESIS